MTKEKRRFLAGRLTLAVLAVTTILLTPNIKAQTHWTNELMEAGTGNEAKLGTDNAEPLKLFTNGVERLVIAPDGGVKIDNLAGTGPRLLSVDQYGNLKPAYGTIYQSSPCNANAIPWFEGGNTVYQSTGVIGTCNERDFILKVHNTELIFMKPTGLIGIGLWNTSPQALVDIGDGTGSHLMIRGDVGGNIEATDDMNLHYGIGNNFSITDFNGHKFSINGSGNVNIPGQLEVESRFDLGKQTGATNVAKLNINVATTPYSAVNAIDVFDQTSGTNGKVNFRVNSFGYVYCRELHINTTAFPDFVFDKGYKLLTLKERERYIKEQGHLPHMISAEETLAEGAPMGKVMLGVLQNTEELTLYLFELNRKVEALVKEKEELKSEINKTSSKR